MAFAATLSGTTPKGIGSWCGGWTSLLTYLIYVISWMGHIPQIFKMVFIKSTIGPSTGQISKRGCNVWAAYHIFTTQDA
jgi:hypothetical protein